MDLTQWLETQIAWSRKTFGTEPRLEGILKHIEKEIVEVRKDPTDAKEWIDIAILALDGAWRAKQAHYVSQIEAKVIATLVTETLQAKSLENMFVRSWPPPGAADQPVEHVRAKPVLKNTPEVVQGLISEIPEGDKVLLLADVDHLVFYRTLFDNRNSVCVISAQHLGQHASAGLLQRTRPKTIIAATTLTEHTMATRRLRSYTEEHPKSVTFIQLESEEK